MKYIVASSHGINWMFYHILEIDEKIGTCRELDSWRAHKFENQGYHAITEYRAKFIKRNFDISKWIADGKPGGMDGLRENYEKHPVVRISTRKMTAIFNLI